MKASLLKRPCFLFGNGAPAPVIRGFTVEMAPDEWVTARQGEKRFFVGETRRTYVLIPIEYREALGTKRNPEGLCARTDRILHMPKENL